MNLQEWFRPIGSWFAHASPWIQGLFGGVGATLVWEGVLKPARERRSVAHVLAEEIGLNLDLAVKQLAMFEHNPSGVPQDFRFLTKVFESVVENIGSLPTSVVGDVVLLYAGLDAMNRIPDKFAAALESRDALRRTDSSNPNSATISMLQAKTVERDLQLQLTVFKSGVAKAADRANEVLPRLRRTSVPLWRLDYYVRRRRLLSVDDARRDVAAHARRLGFRSKDNPTR